MVMNSKSLLSTGRLIGRLLYLNFSRLDVAFVAQQLSQFIDRPTSSHWKAALHLLRYLRGTMNHGLVFDADSSLQLEAYCDADWGTCLDSRKSITGYCIFIGSSLISWKAKKQPTCLKGDYFIANSSTL
ncbi:uncharacterized mitochondrial protein AtMg00810-like [Andrographis paniculata]|uniref:uncharacterized mitochondrial protein AtMg00810-like n=1 Tax=Andrographis paniculata TaxID=175694 RepID=UPI0021E83EE3|nr:uncharacterized mitochondrial protein AtMg00810-like [Andrographis paniculata]